MGTKSVKVPKEQDHFDMLDAVKSMPTGDLTKLLKELGHNVVEDRSEKQPALKEIAEGLRELGLQGILVDAVKGLGGVLGSLVEHGVKTSDFDGDYGKLSHIAQQARLIGNDEVAAKALAASVDLIVKKNS
jgi:hypothetical protein